MRVLLLTNIVDQCGISEYGKNLARFMPRYPFDDQDEMFVTLMDVDEPTGDIMKQAESQDVVHLNWQQGVHRHFDPGAFVTSMRALEQCPPLVFTKHLESEYEAYQDFFDVIVTHKEAPPISNVESVVIPHGIVDLRPELEPRTIGKLVLGQCGFPYVHKRYDRVCHAAVALQRLGHNPSVFFIIPTTNKSDPTFIIRMCQKILGSVPATYVTEWMESDDVARLMNQEVSVAVYPGGEGKGTSGSVRMAVTAMVPVVLNAKGELFSDVVSRLGMHSFKTDAEIPSVILKAWQEGIPPMELLQDQGWFATGKLYAQAYKKAIAHARS